MNKILLLKGSCVNLASQRLFGQSEFTQLEFIQSFELKFTYSVNAHTRALIQGTVTKVQIKSFKRFWS